MSATFFPLSHGLDPWTGVWCRRAIVEKKTSIRQFYRLHSCWHNSTVCVFFRSGTSGRVNVCLCGRRYPYTPLFPSSSLIHFISSSSPPLVLLLLDDYKLPLKLRAKCPILNFSVWFNLLPINVLWNLVLLPSQNHNMVHVTCYHSFLRLCRHAFYLEYVLLENIVFENLVKYPLSIHINLNLRFW